MNTDHVKTNADDTSAEEREGAAKIVGGDSQRSKSPGREDDGRMQRPAPNQDQTQKPSQSRT